MRPKADLRGRVVVLQELGDRGQRDVRAVRALIALMYSLANSV